ncbi:MAG: NUDIX hydrolase [Fusobacteriaceae bacterium]|jgi:ADP-ribose pyrophosphatase|nr:NUDIX hydrolase [Fusobacteriaceae bacterium]
MKTEELKFLKIATEPHPASGFTLEYLDKPNAIAALFLDAAGEKALLVKQYRPGYRGELLEVPAGIMEAGEDPLTTLHRELREETGYGPGDYTLLYTPEKSLILSPGCSTERLFVYIAQLKKAAGKPERLRLDEGEILEDHWADLGEIEKATADFKTIFALNLYKLIKKA